MPKVYRIGRNYYLLQLISTLFMAIIGGWSVITLSNDNPAHLGVSFPFVAIVVMAVINLFSSFGLRLILTEDGLEYRAWGYGLKANWSDIKAIESDTLIGECVRFNKCIIDGYPRLSFFFRPMTYDMAVPLSYRTGILWEENVVPDILACVQAAKSKQIDLLFQSKTL